MVKLLKIALLPIIVFLSFNSLGFAKSKKINRYRLNKIIKEVSRKSLMKDLRSIVYTGSPNRFYGTSGHKLVQDYLLDFLEQNKSNGVSVYVDGGAPDIEIGKKLYQEDFDKKIKGKFGPSSAMYKKWDKFTRYMKALVEKQKETKIKNMIWFKKGESDETLVVTAHYDTVSHNPSDFSINKTSKMPGADYNASGVSIAMGLIKTLNKLEAKKSVMVVFLDFQSLGFLGSHSFAKYLKSKKIKGVINLEMLGHDSRFFDKKKKTGNMRVYSRRASDPGHKNDVALIKLMEKGNKTFSTSVSFRHLANHFDSSDSFRFWQQGIASVTYTQNWEDDFNTKGYQGPNDFPETINQLTLYNSYVYLARGIAGFQIGL